MKITIQWLDTEKLLAQQEQPILMLKKTPIEEYMVPQGPLVENDPKWALTREGEYVRVPIFAYLTKDRAMAWILATGIEIGSRACASLQQEPLELVLLLGQECTDLAPEGRNHLRCYVGVAARTR
jgi:hypothetical protein